MLPRSVDLTTNGFNINNHFTAARIGDDGKGGHAVTRAALERAVGEALADGTMDSFEKEAISRNVRNLAGTFGRTLMSDDARQYYGELQRQYGLEDPSVGLRARQVNESFQQAQQGAVGDFWLTKDEIQKIFAAAVRFTPFGRAYIPAEAKQAIVENLASWTYSAGAAWGGIVANLDALDEYARLAKLYELPHLTFNGEQAY